MDEVGTTNRKREHEGRNGMNDRRNHESGMKRRHVMVMYRMFLNRAKEILSKEGSRKDLVKKFHFYLPPASPTIYIYIYIFTPPTHPTKYTKKRRIAKDRWKIMTDAK